MYESLQKSKNGASLEQKVADKENYPSSTLIMITSAYSDNLTELSIGTKGMPRAISYNHACTYIILPW